MSHAINISRAATAGMLRKTGRAGAHAPARALRSQARAMQARADMSEGLADYLASRATQARN